MKSVVYKTTESNLVKVGEKYYGLVHYSILDSNPAIQRTELSSERKVNTLAKNFNKYKMDALRVVAHPEEGKFSIVDGDHRFRAGRMIGMEMFPCEVIYFNGSKEDRLKFEATLFATQLDEVEPLSSIQKHKANLIRGIEANQIIEEMIIKYKIDRKPSAQRGLCKANVLSGFDKAIRIAERCGRDVTNAVFFIINGCRWNLEPNGYSGQILCTLANVISLHPEYEREIVRECVKLLKDKTPNQFISEATVAYPTRKGVVKTTLHLEDMLCKKINGMNPEYKKGIISVTERHIA